MSTHTSNSDHEGQEIMYCLLFSIYLLVKASGVIPHEFMIVITVLYRSFHYGYPFVSAQVNKLESKYGKQLTREYENIKSYTSTIFDFTMSFFLGMWQPILIMSLVTKVGQVNDFIWEGYLQCESENRVILCRDNIDTHSGMSMFIIRFFAIISLLQIWQSYRIYEQQNNFQLIRNTKQQPYLQLINMSFQDDGLFDIMNNDLDNKNMHKRRTAISVTDYVLSTYFCKLNPTRFLSFSKHAISHFNYVLSCHTKIYEVISCFKSTQETQQIQQPKPQLVEKAEPAPAVHIVSMPLEEPQCDKKLEQEDRTSSFYSDQQTVTTTDLGDDDTEDHLEVDDEEKDEPIEDSPEFEEELQKFANRLNQTFSTCKQEQRLKPNVQTAWIEKCKQETIKK